MCALYELHFCLASPFHNMNDATRQRGIASQIYQSSIIDALLRGILLSEDGRRTPRVPADVVTLIASMVSSSFSFQSRPMNAAAVRNYLYAKGDLSPIPIKNNDALLARDNLNMILTSFYTTKINRISIARQCTTVAIWLRRNDYIHLQFGHIVQPYPFNTAAAARLDAVAKSIRSGRLSCQQMDMMLRSIIEQLTYRRYKFLYKAIYLLCSSFFSLEEETDLFEQCTTTPKGNLGPPGTSGHRGIEGPIGQRGPPGLMS